jgi:hypothetical protein
MTFVPALLAGVVGLSLHRRELRTTLVLSSTPHGKANEHAGAGWPAQGESEMDTKELVEMARSLAAQIDPMLIGGRDAALLNGLADTIERLERERDRYRSGLEVLATSFYKDDQHQDYAKHVLGDAQISAESELTTLRARVAKMEEALKRISRPHDCGCVPCVGQCRSQESLEIANEGMRETAREALTEEPAS